MIISISIAHPWISKIDLLILAENVRDYHQHGESVTARLSLF